MSLIIQLASLAFWLPLEIYQADDLAHPQWVIWLRFKNIGCVRTRENGRLGPEHRLDDLRSMGLSAHHDMEFLPFVLRRIGEAPKWVVDMAFADVDSSNRSINLLTQGSARHDHSIERGGLLSRDPSRSMCTVERGHLMPLSR